MPICILLSAHKSSGLTYSPERQSPYPREIWQNEVSGHTRGHGFGYARQQREFGHDTAESAQLARVQFQAAFDQDHG